MTDSVKMQLVFAVVLGGIATGTLFNNISEYDGAVLLRTWAWVSISALSFLALWQWDNNRWFPVAFIIASIALLNIWSDLEILLEVNWTHGFSWNEREPIPVVPLWFRDWVLYSISSMLWVVAIIIGTIRYKRPY